jgi:hypothetical protein
MKAIVLGGLLVCGYGFVESAQQSEGPFRLIKKGDLDKVFNERVRVDVFNKVIYLCAENNLKEDFFEYDRFNKKLTIQRSYYSGKKPNSIVFRGENLRNYYVLLYDQNSKN